MNYQDWIAISEALKTTAFSAETMAIARSTPGYIGAPVYNYAWIDTRTYQQVPSPWLKLGPLTQEDINYTALIEVETGYVEYSFPAYTVPPLGPVFNPLPQPVVSSVIQGTEGNDNLLGTASSETIVGLGGNDRLIGYGGNDILKGGNNNDRLVGGNGNDTLWGGNGNNVLVGNNGRDVFVLEPGLGRSVIRDFRDRQDKLGLLPDMKLNRLRIEQRGNRTIVSMGNDVLAVLQGVRESQITTADFTQSV